MITAKQRARNPGKHSAAHPWYRGLPNNRRFIQFEEEQKAARRGLELGLLRHGRPAQAAPEAATPPSKGGRPNRTGIVVPFNRTLQPREYHRAYVRKWKKLRS